MWWEEEFTIAFKKNSGLKSSDNDKSNKGQDDGVVKNTKPCDFILLVIETSEEFLGEL